MGRIGVDPTGSFGKWHIVGIVRCASAAYCALLALCCDPEGGLLFKSWQRSSHHQVAC